MGSVLLDGAAVDAAVGELVPLDGRVAAAAEVDAAMWWPDYAPYRPAVGVVDPEP